MSWTADAFYRLGMDGGFVLSETDVTSVRLATAARKLTDTIARCRVAIAVAEENVERAQLALDTAEQRLRRAQDMQARSRARRQRAEGGGRMNNAGHGATPLHTGFARVPDAATGRESGTDSRESA